jgi:DNA-3-methyladenine glycosylase II
MTVSTQEMKQIVQELSSRDDRLAAVIASHRLCSLGQGGTEGTHFEDLVESVISQQLSIKAADTIYARLVTLAGNSVTPETVLQISEAQMRQAGVSGAKYKTIQGLANAAVTGSVPINELHLIDDDEVIAAQLTSLWGIGSWTVDMFMMHRLNRLDVWPIGDVGVRRGWEKIYSLSERIEPRELFAAGEGFRPYRSVVAWYCWQAGDN